MKSAITMAIFILLVIIFSAGIDRVWPRAEKPMMHASNVDDKTCLTRLTFASILIRNGEFTPSKVTVPRCTYVEFRNFNNTNSLPALGEHDDHTSYPGFRETTLVPGETYSFQATTTGTFIMHDHLNDSTKGELIVE